MKGPTAFVIFALLAAASMLYLDVRNKPSQYDRMLWCVQFALDSGATTAHDIVGSCQTQGALQ